MLLCGRKNLSGPHPFPAIEDFRLPASLACDRRKPDSGRPWSFTRGRGLTLVACRTAGSWRMHSLPWAYRRHRRRAAQTYVKAHRSARGRRAPRAQAIGHSRGGHATKIHAVKAEGAQTAELGARNLEEGARSRQRRPGHESGAAAAALRSYPQIRYPEAHLMKRREPSLEGDASTARNARTL